MNAPVPFIPPAPVKPQSDRELQLEAALVNIVREYGLLTEPLAAHIAEEMPLFAAVQRARLLLRGGA